MKKTEPTKRSLREIPEIDVGNARRLPRGKYTAKAHRSFFEVALVEPELFAHFGSSEAINAALRALVDVAGATYASGYGAGWRLRVGCPSSSRSLR